MRISVALLLWIFGLGCSNQKAEPLSSTPAIASAFFGVVESELTPGILVHSQSKYLGLFADGDAPAYLAFATRNGPRSFKSGEKLKADEMEESWLLLWATNLPPWVVYLQHKPRAMTLDAGGLHLSFGNAAGDVVLLPLHGASTNVNTGKWPEFLPREPLMRIRYWASVLREFPIACERSFNLSNQVLTVHQKFRFHSIRDDWKTKPLKLAPVSPPLASAADEKLKRKLMDLEMPTPFGPYMGFESVTEWRADFLVRGDYRASCPWVGCAVDAPNTTLVAKVETNGWPRIEGAGSISFLRDQAPPAPEGILMSPNSRLILYEQR